MKKIYIYLLVAALLLFIFPLTAAAEELTLEKSVELMVENNRQLENVRRDISNAERDLEIAGRSFFPTLDLQTSYSKQDEGQMTFNPEFDFESALQGEDQGELFVEGSDENYSTSLRLSQPIWLGGRISLNKEIAGYRIEIARTEYQKKVEEQIFNLIQSYYGLLQAEEAVKIRKEAVSTAEEHLKAVEKRLEAGTTVKQDLLRSRIEKRRAEEELTASENNLKTAERRFYQLINIEAETEWQLKKPELEDDIDIEREELFEDALQNNKELMILELNKEILNKNKKLEGQHYRPQVNLNASYDWQGDSFLDEESWSVSVSGSMSIFDGGKSSLEAEKIDEEKEKLNNSKLDLIENIDINIEEVILSVEENREVYELEKLSLENAEENLELANSSYEAGVGTNRDVLDAQLAYRQSQLALMQADFKLEEELLRAIYESGRLSEYFKEVINNE